MSEKNEFKRDGAVPQKNSGRGPYQKGDAIYDDYFVVDLKEYEKSFTISRQVWSKICSDTIKNGSQYSPALKIVLGKQNKIRLWVIDEETLEELLEYKWMYEELQ